MDLGETGVSEQCASFVGAIGCGDVATPRVSRKIKDIAIPAGREHDRISSKALNFTSAQAAGDDAFGVSVNQYQVEHFGLGKHLNSAGFDLTTKRLITTKQQLLAG